MNKRIFWRVALRCGSVAFALLLAQGADAAGFTNAAGEAASWGGSAAGSGAAAEGATALPAAPSRHMRLPPQVRRIPVMPPDPPRLTGFAAAPELSPSPLGADQIVANNIAARGGLAAWEAITSLRSEGRMEAGRARTAALPATGSARSEQAQLHAEARQLFERIRLGERVDPAKVIELPFVLEQQRGHKQRLEIPFQGQVAVQVYDGVRGWKLRPFLGRHTVEPYSPEQARLAGEQQELDGPLINYRAKGTRLEVEGIERIDGRSAYRLKLVLRDGGVRHVWVDAQDWLESRVDGHLRMDGRERAVWTDLRDYRQVGGVRLPFHLETRVEGVPGSESIHIEQVALNPALDPARFLKPE